MTDIESKYNEKPDSIMKEYFLRMLEYSVWANKQTLDCISQQKVKDEKVLTLFSHILASQYIWVNRLLEVPPPPYGLWKQLSIDEMRLVNDRVNEEWLRFLQNCGDFKHVQSYKNLSGKSFSNSVETILTHVFNHNTYHRGQIALRLRETGFEPMTTDYIIFDRVLKGQLST